MIDIVCSCLKLNRIRIRRAPALPPCIAAVCAAKSSETAKAAEISVIAARLSLTIAASKAVIAVALLLLLHDLVVGLLHLFKPLLRLLSVRIIDIGVRMVFPAQVAVCFFDVIVTGTRGHPEHLIRICHGYFSSCNFLSFLHGALLPPFLPLIPFYAA